MEPIYYIIGLFAGVLSYLALSGVQQGKQITTLTSKIEVIGAKLDILTAQVNLFIKTEVDTLKEIAKIAKG